MTLGGRLRTTVCIKSNKDRNDAVTPPTQVNPVSQSYGKDVVRYQVRIDFGIFDASKLVEGVNLVKGVKFMGSTVV